MDDGSPRDDIKRRAILDAAFGVFSNYGFRRTSMGDIAQAAGMSRPALYQYFEGKEDIARSLVGAFYDDTCGDVAQALAQPGTPAQVLRRGFAAKSGPALEAILNSPHGAEMLELGSVIAADIAAAGTARLESIFADWLRQAAARGEITLDDSPEAMAATMLAALEGAKAGGRAPDFASYRAHLDRLARVFGAALST